MRADIVLHLIQIPSHKRGYIKKRKLLLEEARSFFPLRIACFETGQIFQLWLFPL